LRFFIGLFAFFSPSGFALADGKPLPGEQMKPEGADVLSWSQFRGPEANPVGRESKLPLRWSQSENVEWSTEIPGRGWSSPIVHGDRIYVTTTITEGASKSPQTGTEFSNEYVAELAQQGLSQEEILKRVTQRDIELPHEVTVDYVLMCLDLNSGKELWRRTYHHGQPPGGRHRKNSFTSETPITDGERIYIHAGNLGVFAFTMDGELSWSQTVQPHQVYLDFGTGSSPILAEDLVVVMNDNEEASYLAAWDKRTGEARWRVPHGLAQEDGNEDLAKSGWVTPYLWRNSRRTEIIAPGSDHLISYGLDGKVLWSMRGMGKGLASSSFAIGDQLIVNAGRGQAIYSVRPGGQGDISLAKGQASNEWIEWTCPRAGTYIPTPVAYEQGLYIISDNGILTRLDLTTGEQSYRTRVKGTEADFTTSPWAYNGHLFFASEQGDVFVVPAGEQYTLSHVNSMGELAMASPALVGERLLFRTESKLVSIRNASPS
jgi:outer membrane protein assembly factor BamB